MLKDSVKLGLAGAALLSSPTLFANSQTTANVAKMQFLALNNGIKMPILGLGTYLLKGREGQNAISEAIEVGYRHF